VAEKKIVVTTLSQIQFHREAYERFHYPDWEQAVYERHWEFMLRDFKLGLEAGVRFALGTDLIGAPTHPLKEAATEFVLAVEHGMAPADALRAGTILAAEVLGVEHLTGSIEKGKLADLVALPYDPMTRIEAVKFPLFVMKQGAVVRDGTRSDELKEKG
jgi:imidazolonepropionase-like amidohydrolase